MKTVILESLGISDEKLQALEAPFLAEGVEFVHCARTADPEVKKAEIADADAVILANMPLEADVIRSADHLKFIDVAFTGVNHVGLEAAREKGIAVSNAAGYSNEAVAELGVGMVLSVYRYLRQVEDSCRSGGTINGMTGMEIRGKKVGIVGYGAIGRRSAELFHAFGAEITACKKHRTDDIPDYVELTDLKGVLESSDIVLLHCPLNDETKGLINAGTLGYMKPDAILVNLARGPVVDRAALIEALNAGKLRCACLDVFEGEPPLTGDPILEAPRTLLTPHIGFATKEALEARAEIVFGNLACWMQGSPRNSVL